MSPGIGTLSASFAEACMPSNTQVLIVKIVRICSSLEYASWQDHSSSKDLGQARRIAKSIQLYMWKNKESIVKLNLKVNNGANTQNLSLFLKGSITIFYYQSIYSKSHRLDMWMFFSIMFSPLLGILINPSTVTVFPYCINKTYAS